MSFNEIRSAYNNPSKKDGMSAIIEIVNKRLVGSEFMIQREHMATVGLFHCVLTNGKITSSSRLMGGTEESISGFLAGLYLGYELGEKDAG